MRLDKFISQAAQLTRTQAKQAIKNKRVSVNQSICINSAIQIKTSDQVSFDQQACDLELIISPQKNYFILNKPSGYICSTQDEVHPSALNLLTTKITSLHFAGRLDVDTTGLVLISDDGQWTHRVTSPRKQCKKVYRVTSAMPINKSQINALQKGVILKDQKQKTLPAEIMLISENEMLLTLSEGRYHQVKRMLAAVGNHVEKLHREQIGELNLHDLNAGEWRKLTAAEVKLF